MITLKSADLSLFREMAKTFFSQFNLCACVSRNRVKHLSPITNFMHNYAKSFQNIIN